MLYVFQIFSYNEADDEEETPMDKTPSKGAPPTKQKGEDLEQLNFFIDTGVKQDKLVGFYKVLISCILEVTFYLPKHALPSQNFHGPRKI